MVETRSWTVAALFHQDFGLNGHFERLSQALNRDPDTSFELHVSRAELSAIKNVVRRFRADIALIYISYPNANENLNEFGGLISKLRKRLPDVKVAVVYNPYINQPYQERFLLRLKPHILIRDSAPEDLWASAFLALLKNQTFTHKDFIYPPSDSSS